jgi:hypothetical protein
MNNILMLTLESDEQGSTVVSDEVFRVYGYGDTQQEALYDYIISLQEYYQILSRHDDLPTRRLFAYLKSHLCA